MSLALLCWAVALAQRASPTEASPVTKERVPAFQSKVNLVLIPVVVRDARGRPVGNLTRDDFQLFDKRKAQTISSFSAVRRMSAARGDKGAAAARATDSGPAGLAAANKTPQRFLIYLFDDLNTDFADMAALREAAVRHFRSGLPASDRAAIYTFSGRLTSEFTGDRTTLEDTVRKLRVQQTFGHGGMQCPDVNYYVADLIVNRSDQQALLALAQQTVACSRVPLSFATKIAESAARREVFAASRILGFR